MSRVALPTWRAVMLGALAVALAPGDAQAREKRGRGTAAPSSSGCCPTCICGGLIAPTEAKRRQSGQRPRSQVSPPVVR